MFSSRFHAGGGVHKVQTVGVYVGRSGDVQLVHLLLTGREEEVAVSALLDLGLESTGGIEVEAEGDARVLGRVVLGDGVQGLGQGGSGKDDELDALAGSSEEAAQRKQLRKRQCWKPRRRRRSGQRKYRRHRPQPESYGGK